MCTIMHLTSALTVLEILSVFSISWFSYLKLLLSEYEHSGLKNEDPLNWGQNIETGKVKVTLRLMVSQSVCLGIEHPCGTCDQILLPVGMLLSEICSLVSVGRPL
jgi:hypothetical protein